MQHSKQASKQASTRGKPNRSGLRTATIQVSCDWLGAALHCIGGLHWVGLLFVLVVRTCPPHSGTSWYAESSIENHDCKKHQTPNAISMSVPLMTHTLGAGRMKTEVRWHAPECFDEALLSRCLSLFFKSSALSPFFLLRIMLVLSLGLYYKTGTHLRS
jgi:hypothetical protein